MAEKIIEYRVWRETGDLLASAILHVEPGYVWAEYEPYGDDDSLIMKRDGSAVSMSYFWESEGKAHCKELAERWVEKAREECPCEPDERCGTFEPHGISLQIVGDD